MKRLEIGRLCKLVHRQVGHWSDYVTLDKSLNFFVLNEYNLSDHMAGTNFLWITNMENLLVIFRNYYGLVCVCVCEYICVHMCIAYLCRSWSSRAWAMCRLLLEGFLEEVEA